LKIVNAIVEGFGVVEGGHCAEVKNLLFEIGKKLVDMI
jgi:hypothetical protein